MAENKFKELVNTAYDAVGDIKEDSEAHAIGFKLVLTSLLGGATSTTNHVTPENGKKIPENSQGGSDTGWSNKLASRLDLSVDEIHEIYHMSDDGEIAIVIEHKKLPSTNSRASKHLAMLLCAARQGAGLESSTSFDVIRSVCEEYKVYDSKNFSASMKELGAKFRIQGPQSARTMELINGAFPQVSTVAKQYLEAK